MTCPKAPPCLTKRIVKSLAFLYAVLVLLVHDTKRDHRTFGQLGGLVEYETASLD